jgi:hypothetical protein
MLGRTGVDQMLTIFRCVARRRPVRVARVLAQLLGQLGDPLHQRRDLLLELRNSLVANRQLSLHQLIKERLLRVAARACARMRAHATDMAPWREIASETCFWPARNLLGQRALGDHRISARSWGELHQRLRTGRVWP